MRFTTKIIWLAVILAVVFAVSFVIAGDWFEQVLDPQVCASWFASMKPVAWLVGIALLIGDLILPVPATGVMMALGMVYGTFLGGIFGGVGSVLAGLAGYWIAAGAGSGWVSRLASAEERKQVEGFFNRWGGASIIASRAFPIFPEVLSILAGMARMRFGLFTASLALGSFPTAFLFAWIGDVARETPALGLTLSIVVPLILWLAAARIFKLNQPVSNREEPEVSA